MEKNSPEQMPTSDEIVAALARTGFLLEHRVAKCLRDLDFDTRIGSAYPDPESGKSREFDVHAVKYEQLDRGDFHAMINLDLIIECKNNLMPFYLDWRNRKHKPSLR
jgi:hypothetical protein